MSLLGKILLSSAIKLNYLNVTNNNLVRNQLLAWRGGPSICFDKFYSTDNKKLPGDKDWATLKKCQTQDCTNNVARMDEVMPPMKNNKPPWQKPYRQCKKPPEPKKFTCEDEPKKVLAKRPRKKIYSSSSCKNPSPSKDASCNTPKKNSCKKIQMPGCVKAKQPPKCIKHRVVSNCKKPKAPLPSFHECLRDPLYKQKITECNCLKKPGTCK